MSCAIVVYIFIVNIVAIVVYGIDKLKAKKNKWRISENTLLLIALVGGSIGAYLAMKLWHHKTNHKKFKYGIPLIIMFQLVVSAYWLIGLVNES